MGNGGSSCDAAHIAVEFQHPVTAGRPALAGAEPGAGHGDDDRGRQRRRLRRGVRAPDARADAGAGDVAHRRLDQRQLGQRAARPRSARASSARTRWRWPAATAAGWRTRRCVDLCLTVASDSIHRVQETPCGDLPRAVGPGAQPAGRRPRPTRQRMKYVDEFRDPLAARALVREIGELPPNAWARPKPAPLQIMEVCGGHTHSIFRYALEGPDAAGASSSCTARAARSACCRWARVDDCIAIARAARTSSSPPSATRCACRARKGSLLQARADGADVRMVYSPLDALALAAGAPAARGSSSSRSASRPRCRRPR